MLFTFVKSRITPGRTSMSHYSLIILEHTKTPVQNVDHTFSSQDDIMMKLNDENKPVLISTIIIALAIFALILLWVYVSTFAVAPCPQRI